MHVPITTLAPTSSHRQFRLFAAISAVLAVLQTVVAVTMLATDNEILVRAHEGLGFLYAAAAVVTFFPALVWGRLSKSMGLVGHAGGMAVLAVVQLLLGLLFSPEEGQPLGPLMYVHMGLGLAILLGAAFLYAAAAKKPIIVTAVDDKPHA